MSIVGHVRQIWRYPVKSMGGECLEQCELGAGLGIPGDRGWAVRDEAVGEIRGAKRIPELLRCNARYLAEPGSEEIPPVEITLPDGASLISDAPDASARLSQALGREVTLWPRQPASDLEHYRRRAKSDEADVRAQLGLLPDEPLPDFSRSATDLVQFATPPGTYFDSYQLHVLTDGSLATLQRHAPDSRIEAKRFRPNLVIEVAPGAADLPEIEWCGHELRIGATRIQVDAPMLRCVMTTCAQGELPSDPAIMRALVRQTGQDLGVGASIAAGGRIAVGDAIELHERA